MPEMPEVETIARMLRDAGLSGREVLAMEMRWPRHIASPAPEEAARRIVHHRFEGVERRGKFLVFPLGGLWMLIHLRMSGDLCLVESADACRKHDLTIFHLSDGFDLRFHDPRRFGRVWLTDDPHMVLGRLGPEPFADDFTAAALSKMLHAHRRLLKPLLLDQTFLAGIGNIYADESLHRARLHPLRLSDSLRPEEVKRLWRGIRGALRDGLRHNGASIDWVYRGGEFQNHFRAYGREGERCRVCRAVIRRITVGQRSSYFCPHCQPAPRKRSRRMK